MLLRSLKPFEIVLDHVDVAFVVVQLLLIYGLISSLDYLHLFNILLASSLQTLLQKVPKDEIDNTVHHENCPE
jgi:hypothetical protein